MSRTLSLIPLRSLVLGLAGLAALSIGCNRAPSADNPTGAPNANSAAASTPAASSTAAPAPPAVITNRFDMKFRLISVEPKPADAPAPKFGLTYPTASYYFAERPLTEKQYLAFRESIAERDRGQPRERRKFYEYPDEWQDAYNYAVELSAIDPDYDYRLPTREEYAFACLNGYDQDCPVGAFKNWKYEQKRPNKFGLQDLTNGQDVEFGDLKGLYFGMSFEHTPPEAQACPCAQYGYGNLSGDDGFEGICRPRFVLTPKVK